MAVVAPVVLVLILVLVPWFGNRLARKAMAEHRVWVMRQVIEAEHRRQAGPPRVPPVSAVDAERFVSEDVDDRPDAR